MHVNRIKQIWRGLVDYANSTDIESDSRGLRALAGTVSECMPWMARGGYFGNDVQLLLAAMDAIPKEKFLFSAGEESVRQFRQQAIEYRPRVRELLTWLSDPKKESRYSGSAFGFLTEHMKHTEITLSEVGYRNDEVPDEVAPNFDRNFPHRTFLYKDIADPICDFIYQEHEARNNVPIRICKRPGCGNLVARFKKKEYCRTESCDKVRQRRDDGIKQKKNRDRVLICRLNQLPPAMRRKKAQQKADSLREILSYWQDSSHNNATLARQALTLLKATGNSSEDAKPSTPVV